MTLGHNASPEITQHKAYKYYLCTKSRFNIIQGWTQDFVCFRHPYDSFNKNSLTGNLSVFRKGFGR